VFLTEELADTLRNSEAGTDLRIDWADAASLGFDGEQYFLVVVDKGTEHVVTFNTKTRSDPVDLLAQYLANCHNLFSYNASACRRCYWYYQATFSNYSTPKARLQSTFAGKMSTVAHPLALVLSPDSQNFTAKLLAKVWEIAMLKVYISTLMLKRQRFICTI
jgi:hypothetical protein